MVAGIRKRIAAFEPSEQFRKAVRGWGRPPMTAKIGDVTMISGLHRFGAGAAARGGGGAPMRRRRGGDRSLSGA